MLLKIVKSGENHLTEAIQNETITDRSLPSVKYFIHRSDISEKILNLTVNF